MKLNNIILGTVTLSTLGLIGGLTKQASASTGVSVYRLYNPNTGEHFYTENAYEKNSLSNSGWKYEGIGWQSATSGTPVYRVYNPNAKGGDHYYTMSRYEAQSLISQGWRWDNGGKPSFYSAGNTNLYVAYNPNAQSGSHNYTTNSYEQNSLLKGGWKYGSVAWKVMGSAPAPENNSSQKLILKKEYKASGYILRFYPNSVGQADGVYRIDTINVDGTTNMGMWSAYKQVGNIIYDSIDGTPISAGDINGGEKKAVFRTEGPSARYYITIDPQSGNIQIGGATFVPTN